MNKVAKRRLANAKFKHRSQVQRVEIVEPKTGVWRFRVRPIFLWRVLEVCGFAIAIWALLETVQNNQLTRAALEETKQQSKLALDGLAETRRQTELSHTSLEIARNEIERNQVIQAWQILTTKAPGNSGKIEALEALNRARQSLRGIDLSCATMGGWDTGAERCSRKTWLRNLELPKARLSGSNLSGSNLRSARLSGSLLVNTNLSGAELSDADLSDSFLPGADLSGSNLTGANLIGAYLTSAYLSGANLSVADLMGANLSDANLTGANLLIAKLSDANLSGANLSAADLSDANLSGANLSGADLTGAKLSDTDLTGADLAGADLAGADLAGADLLDANLSGTVFCRKSAAGSAVVCTKNLTQIQIQTAWGWADRPPQISAGAEGLPFKRPPPRCDPALRPAYEAAKNEGKPEGC